MELGQSVAGNERKICGRVLGGIVCFNFLSFWLLFPVSGFVRGPFSFLFLCSRMDCGLWVESQEVRLIQRYIRIFFYRGMELR